jgi:hypothetical protein
MKIYGRFVVFVAALLVLCSVVSLVRGLRIQQRSVCSNNLLQIAAAKGSIGLENQLSRGERVSAQAFAGYLKGGWDGLRCPAGGQYDPGLFTGDKGTGEADHAPACSVHGSLVTLEFVNPNYYFVFSAVFLGVAVIIALAYFVGRGRAKRQVVTPESPPID